MGWREQRGACVVCDFDYRLRIDGKVRRHPDGLGGTCAGSDRFPVDHVHVCECGCRWDEEAG